MKFPRLQNHILKIFAVVAASLMLPGLALAGTDNGKGNNGQNNGNQNGKTKNGDPSVSSVPEANPVIVLIPFVGAVLLVSSLQLLRRRSSKERFYFVIENIVRLRKPQSHKTNSTVAKSCAEFRTT